MSSYVFLIVFSYFVRFCVVIKKENYPEQQPAKMVAGSAKQIYRQPGHTIYLLPTLVLSNLLPCDLNYYIKGTSIKGTMKPGKEAVLHAADTSQNIELGEVENKYISLHKYINERFTDMLWAVIHRCASRELSRV